MKKGRKNKKTRIHQSHNNTIHNNPKHQIYYPKNEKEEEVKKLHRKPHRKPHKKIHKIDIFYKSIFIIFLNNHVRPESSTETI